MSIQNVYTVTHKHMRSNNWKIAGYCVALISPVVVQKFYLAICKLFNILDSAGWLFVKKWQCSVNKCDLSCISTG